MEDNVIVCGRPRASMVERARRVPCVDAERSRHAEMHQQHVAALHVGHQVLRTAAKAAHHFALQARDKILLERKSQAVATGLDARDPLPLHHRLQAAPDGFNLG